eukprot:475160_1
MRLAGLFSLWLILSIKGEEDIIETVDVDASGASCESDDPNVITVVFENQSGSSVELYSDTATAVYFKGALENGESVTIDTFIGERFYFTPRGSGGSHERWLYQKIMKKSTKSVILYPKAKMNEVIKRGDVGCEGSKCKIIIENKTGKPLEAYWDDNADGVFQGIVSIGDEMTQHTSIGHRFFFTTSADRKTRLHAFTVTADTNLVTLK